MDKLSRKEEERIRRRNHILDAAEQIISDVGFESTTIDQIAERAEVGKGTLYLHFKSKSSIYVAICERGSAMLNERMARVLTRDMKGLDMVKEIGNTYLRFVRENPQYFYAFNYYEGILADGEVRSSEIAEKCEENAREGMTYIVRALQVGMQDGSIDDSYDPNQLGVMIWGASRGVINIAFLKQQGHHKKILESADIDLDTLIGGFIQLVGSGISRRDQ